MSTNEFIRTMQEQLPKGETFARAYTAFEGDMRVISKDSTGFERRYTVKFIDGKPMLERR